jgi:hypothetical protein
MSNPPFPEERGDPLPRRAVDPDRENDAEDAIARVWPDFA